MVEGNIEHTKISSQRKIVDSGMLDKGTGVGCVTKGMQDWRDSGDEECWKNGIQEWRNAGQEGCRKGGMQDRRDVEKEGCRTGRMQERREE